MGVERQFNRTQVIIATTALQARYKRYTFHRTNVRGAREIKSRLLGR